MYGRTIYFILFHVRCYAFSALTLLVGRQEGIRPVKIDWWGVAVVIYMEQSADCLHMVQLMPLHPKTLSSVASFKSRLFLPFWYRLTRVVLEKRLLNKCSNSYFMLDVQTALVSLLLLTHIRLTALCPGLPRWASTRKVKPIWILLEQETVSGSGISWAVCKFAPRSRQITTPAPHRSVFYRPDALPAAQPTVSKHWRHVSVIIN